MLPFTPADAKALIPDPSSSLCGNFVRSLLQLPVLFYQLVNYMFDSSGNPSKGAVNNALPTGSLLFSAVTLSEDGTKLLCDGRTFATSTYPDLSAALGGSSGIYGTASAGNFIIPDFRARFPVGLPGSFASSPGPTIGTPGGEDKHPLTTPELASHSHTYHNDVTNADNAELCVHDGSSGGGGGFTGIRFGGSTRTATAGSGTAHNNLPPYLPCYVYIIT